MNPIEAAASFLLQSPPGEVNDVFNDVRTLIQDDAALESGILPALEQYNTEQLIVVGLSGHNVLISDASKLPSLPGTEDRHLDPRQRVSFLFDHMRVATSDPLPIETDPETETLRADIDKVLETYVANHYSDGVCATYALPDPNYPAPEPELPVAPPMDVEEPAKDEAPATEEDPVEPKDEVEEGEAKMAVEGEEEAKPETEEKVELEAEAEVEEKVEDKVDDVVPDLSQVSLEPKVQTFPAVKSRIFGLYLVGNKYNPLNYWTGRWRSVYTVDLAAATLTGTVKIHIHYYEQGNVQLSTTHTITTPLPSSSATPAQILALVKSSEQDIQNKLADSYATLSDDVFRGLRRALPKTRSKLDWGKISAYRLGTELGGGGQGAEA